jgi:hypothetical protein
MMHAHQRKRLFRSVLLTSDWNVSLHRFVCWKSTDASGRQPVLYNSHHDLVYQ